MFQENTIRKLRMVVLAAIPFGLFAHVAEGQVIEPIFADGIEWKSDGPSTSFTDADNWAPNTVPDHPNPALDDDGVAAVFRTGAAGGNVATINDGDVINTDYLHVWTGAGDAGALNIAGGELNVHVEMRVETEVDGGAWIPADRDTAAIVNQSGGAVTVGTNFRLGRDNFVPAKGLYNMTGGTLDINGAYVSGDAAAGEDAENASGIMNISGGTMTVHSDWSGTDSDGLPVENQVSNSSIRAQFNLSGTGSAVFANPDANVQVGQGNAGDGRILIQDGGSLTVNGQMDVGQQQNNGDINNSEVIIEGGTATLAAVRVGGWGANDLDPELGRSLASFNLSGGAATAASMTVGAHYNTLGDLNISGGTLQVSGVTDVASDPDGTSGAVGNVNVSGGSFQTGSMEVGLLGAGTVNHSNGTVKIESGLAIGVGDQGTYNLTGGVLDMSGSDIGFGAGDGAFNFDGGKILNAANIGFDLVNNGGILARGDGAGTTTITGDYLVVSSDAGLEIEIGGTAVGQSDKLVATGSMILDGSLSVSLLDGFSPADGDSFDILDFTTATGTFANVTLPALGGGLTWDQSELFSTGMLSVMGGGVLLGDFNSDGVLDASDIDQLTGVVIAGSNAVAFDVNGDSVVDQADRRVWISDLRKTWLGDSNLDGEFGSGDLVVVFTAGEYEDATPMNSTWATGDWNGDGDFNTSDLVAAFAGGGFEQGPLAAVAASVPEPVSLLSFLLPALLVPAAVRRRATRR